MNRVVFQFEGQFHQACNPLDVITAHHVDEVLPALARVEAAVAKGHWAIGGLAYEAAPAFDPAMQVNPPPPNQPLLQFGIFKELTPITLEDPANDALAWTPEVKQPDYLQAIRDIRAAIARGETYQVNYTVPFTATAPDDPFATFVRLARAQRAEYAFYAETDSQVICSVSPELFFKADAGRITCRPMKGTASRARDSSGDLGARKTLLASAKERAENVMIVDMIRNDLGRIALTGSVRVPELYTVETYPTVHQLTSTVEAQSNATLTELLSALFPCASITGAPKVKTMEIIAELENLPRGWYCGCLGAIAPKRMHDAESGTAGRIQFNVAIRTLVIDRNTATSSYHAGGGITWDSDPEREWAECLTKTRVLDPPWPEFELFETMRWVPGLGPMRLERHMERLRRSCKYFGRPFPVDAIRNELGRFWAAEISRLRLRLDASGKVSLDTRPFTHSDHPAVVAIDTERLNPDDLFLYHKTTRRHIYEAAKARFPETDDVILVNRQGEATETCIGNLVAEIDGFLITPPIAAGLLPGILRGELLERGDILEAPISLDALKSATRVWRINALRGWTQLNIIER